VTQRIRLSFEIKAVNSGKHHVDIGAFMIFSRKRPEHADGKIKALVCLRVAVSSSKKQINTA
jgi:hypothetical protein